jgi:predicted  nucleic acid-binding Zn-ribbon protein
MDDRLHELDIKVAKMDESLKSEHKRIDKMEQDIDNINNLTLSVHEIAQEMKAMRKEVSDVNGRVKAIEEKPGKRYDAIIEKVIIIVVTAAVTYFISGGNL